MIKLLAALSAALAVAAGAYGAHAVLLPHQTEWFRTASLYQLIHAIAVLAILREARRPALVLLLGSNLFAITLYVRALGGPTWLAPLAPTGGITLIAGWIWAAWILLHRKG